MPVISNFGTSLGQIVGVQPELEAHAHSESEKGHLFSAINSGSAEIEILNLINALVFGFKPKLALETGTGLGYTSLAIASAMVANGFGHLHTVELKELESAAARHTIHHLSNEVLGHITFHVSDSRELIKGWTGMPFDFVLFDSLVEFRHIEFQMLLERELLAPGCLCAFHDTSRHRGETMEDFNAEMIAALDRASAGNQWLELDLSRGLRLIRLPS